MLRKFSVRVPNNRDTVHNIPIELESDINNSNTLFRISGPYQLFTLNTDAHTHTARRWRRRYILATIYSQRNTIHFGINGTININTNRKTAIRCSYLFGSCVICSKRWATHSNISLSLSPSSTLPIYRMAFSIENRIDRQWIFRAKFCGLSKLKFDIHFGRWMGKRDGEWGRMGAMMLAL